jgi:hypothetical protein
MLDAGITIAGAGPIRRRAGAKRSVVWSQRTRTVGRPARRCTRGRGRL